ncbi:MAG: D-alanyl-D-alanine carboxypeptidase [Thiohalocapsa sp.]
MRRTKKHAAKKPTPRPVPSMRAEILVDADTGGVLREANPDRRLFPASLTKMMTLYLTFGALNDGRLDLEQRLPVSPHAAAQEPTKLWLKAGDTVRVRNLILGLVTRSANDAAVVLGEALAGSETAFAEKMTATARRLGMTRTLFRNASGLPDPEQRTTARDLARLALALHRDFPREFAYFSVREFSFRGETITGHNHLLGAYDGSDGIKTGFTRAAGFNLAASAERNGDRLIGVVLGSPSWQVRDKEMVALLDRGFAELGQSPLAAPDTVVASSASGKAAGLARLAALTSPVARAQAAPIPSSLPPATRRIRVGAFRTRAAAQRLARTAARLAPKARLVRIGRGKRRLYTVTLAGLSESAARHACAGLNRKRLACVVLAAVNTH